MDDYKNEGDWFVAIWARHTNLNKVIVDGNCVVVVDLIVDDKWFADLLDAVTQKEAEIRAVIRMGTCSATKVTTNKWLVRENKVGKCRFA